MHQVYVSSAVRAVARSQQMPRGRFLVGVGRNLSSSTSIHAARSTSSCHQSRSLAQAMNVLPQRSTDTCRFFSTGRSRMQQEQAAEEEEKKEMDDGEKNIHDILTREFQPAHLEVRDVSGGCGSFYAIVIASEHFNGKPTVKAHRSVNEALKDVIAGIHGLQLRTMPVKN